MILYLAGNFPQMKNPELEKAVKKDMEDRGYSYNRLVSFYYAKDSETILNIRREENET